MMLDLEGSKELLRDGWRDVNDADRCISMGISPAAGTLHRRLRDVLNNSNALVAEVERQRASEQRKVNYTSANGTFTSTAYVDSETLEGVDKHTGAAVALSVQYVDTNRHNT